MQRPQKFTIQITANEKDLTVTIDNSIEGDPVASAAPKRKRPAAKKKSARRR